MRNTLLLPFVLSISLVHPVAGQAGAAPARRVLSLDGTWQLGEGSLAERPAKFDRLVPVPGLIDMAVSPFVEAGPKVTDRQSGAQRDPRREAFWYRRTFTLSATIEPTAQLVVRKAMFGARVWVNDIDLGEHMPCFTPGFFDVRTALRPGENEIVIRVGASRDQIPPSQPDGFDYEKSRYIPGIFDSVELILAGEPYIKNVQVAPDIAAARARIRIWLSRPEGMVSLEVREAKSGKEVGRAEHHAAGETRDAVVAIRDCRLWSPEDPFLYELIVRTAGDELRARFGMREFFCRDGRAWLNGKVYYLRGDNFTLYRFFEDEARGALPWDEKWVRALHEHVKDMRWNALRYCIGFPPELWYRIADETGILIQDEFPIWGNEKNLSVDELAREYGEWMQERWNHPCVVIWDAQNETVCTQTGEALQRVRALDLSNRPWDNGWSPAQAPGDIKESHPYYFSNAAARLSRLAKRSGVPGVVPGSDAANHAVIINEYDWLWINRDGAATTLTRAFYDGLLGPNATVEQRRAVHARYTAAMTEFWRMRRGCAGVLHFTALGYSRPDGQTCDYFIDVVNLTPEPMFYRLVRDAFAPVGVGIDFFAERVTMGAADRVPVAVVNDLYEAKDATVVLRLRVADKEQEIGRAKVHVEGLAVRRSEFNVAWPAAPAQCILTATLELQGTAPVHSVRHIEVGPPRPSSLARERQVTASSVHDNAYRPENAVDGDEGTYWSSAFRDDAWLSVDLGETKRVRRVCIMWENAYAKAFTVQVSSDGHKWQNVYSTQDGKGGMSEITFAPVEARYVRIECTRRGTQWGHAIYELEVYE